MNRKEFLSISGLVATGLTIVHFTPFAKEKRHYHTIFGNKEVVVGGSKAR